MKNYLVSLFVTLVCYNAIAQSNADNAARITEIEQQIKAGQLKIIIKPI